MSHFLVLNFQDFGLDHQITETIQSQTLFCVCCLEKNEPLLDLTKCDHKIFLEQFTKTKDCKPMNRDLICYPCHTMLQKIEIFRQQIRESYRILGTVTIDSASKNLRYSSLETKKIVDILLNPVPSITQTKQQINKSNSITKDIKIQGNEPKHDENKGNGWESDGSEDKNEIYEQTTNQDSNIQRHVVKNSLASLKRKYTGTNVDPLDLDHSINETEMMRNKKIKQEEGSPVDIKLERIENDHDCDNISEQNDDNGATADDNDEIAYQNDDNVDTADQNDDTSDEDNETHGQDEQIENILNNKSKEANVQTNDDVSQTMTEPQPQITEPKIKRISLSKDELNQERVITAQSRVYLKYPYRCTQCLIGFNYEDNIKDHLKRKHKSKENSVTCEICSQVISPPAALTAHNYRHYTRYECSACERRFPELGHALRHARRAHAALAPDYKCRACHFATPVRSLLTLHKLEHQQFACEECGLVVSSQDAMRRHMLIAHKKSMYTCRTCHTVHCDEQSFNAHMRSHGAAHPRCVPCNVAFKSWHAYNAHVLLSSAHSGRDKSNWSKYTCEDCGQRFNAAFNLRAHAQARHARAPTLRCAHCPLMFTLSVELQQHTQRVHNQSSVVVCERCGRAYRTRQHLLQHKTQAHSAANKLKTQKKSKKRK